MRPDLEGAETVLVLPGLRGSDATLVARGESASGAEDVTISCGSGDDAVMLRTWSWDGVGGPRTPLQAAASAAIHSLLLEQAPSDQSAASREAMRGAGAKARDLGEQVKDARVWEKVTAHCADDHLDLYVLQMETGFAAALEYGSSSLSVWGAKRPTSWDFQARSIADLATA